VKCYLIDPAYLKYSLQENQNILPHLFRREYGKIIAVLLKTYGLSQLAIAEDIASQTFLRAAETWPYKGVPANPTAWLYTVAKNHAKNDIKREKIFTNKIMNQRSTDDIDQMHEIDLSDTNIFDSQLQMLFTLCHPCLALDAQITLALRVMCGFGIDEIADAFLTTKSTINKRLMRAKEKWKSLNVSVAMPSDTELSARLDGVLKTIYLLFTEGYYSTSHRTIVRKDLCFEALQLNDLLLSSPLTSTHDAHALMALMCFQASRLDARTDDNGQPILYHDQDTSLWDNGLIEKGFYHLQQASVSVEKSVYYIEACIAYWYTVKIEITEKWSNVLHLYDVLIKANPSSITLLNRLYAYSKVHGPELALVELEKIDSNDSYMHYILQSELYKNIDATKAIESLHIALDKSNSNVEKAFIAQKIKGLEKVFTNDEKSTIY
jgi:RNA polymerase sigma factor (sigma-70 family)